MKFLGAHSWALVWVAAIKAIAAAAAHLDLVFLAGDSLLPKVWFPCTFARSLDALLTGLGSAAGAAAGVTGRVGDTGACTSGNWSTGVGTGVRTGEGLGASGLLGLVLISSLQLDF